MTYGPGLPDLYRRSATYVDKRLKGANPAELPIERPTKVALVTNLKTAKAFVLTIPPSLLFQASEVTQCVIPGAWVWLPRLSRPMIAVYLRPPQRMHRSPTHTKIREWLFRIPTAGHQGFHVMHVVGRRSSHRSHF